MGLLSNWEGKWGELLPHLPNTREAAQESRETALISQELGFRPWFHLLIAVRPQLNYLTSLSLFPHE